MDDNDIVGDFKSSFESDAIAELLIPLRDSAIDLVADSKVVDRIPVISTLISCYKLFGDIKSYRLAQKIFSFLYHTAEVPVDKKKEFIKDYLISNEENSIAILLDIVDRIDNKNKIIIISNLTIAKIDGSIDIYDYNRLLSCVQDTPYTDLMSLPLYLNQTYVPGQSEILLSHALIYRSYEDFPKNVFKYTLNYNGYLILKYGIKTYQGKIPNEYKIDQPNAIFAAPVG